VLAQDWRGRTAGEGRAGVPRLATRLCRMWGFAFWRRLINRQTWQQEQGGLGAQWEAGVALKSLPESSQPLRRPILSSTNNPHRNTGIPVFRTLQLSNLPRPHSAAGIPASLIVAPGAGHSELAPARFVLLFHCSCIPLRRGRQALAGHFPVSSPAPSALLPPSTNRREQIHHSSLRNTNPHDPQLRIACLLRSH